MWHQPPRRSLAATMQDFAIDGLCSTGERAWQCCLAAQLEVVPSSSTVLIWISGDMRGPCDCKILSNSVVGCTSKFGFYGVVMVIWCWGKLRIPIGKPMRLSTTCERTWVQNHATHIILICIARSAFINDWCILLRKTIQTVFFTWGCLAPAAGIWVSGLWAEWASSWPIQSWCFWTPSQ